MKIDVISQYCVHNDYPIFRYNMKRHKDKINKLILYPSRHHGVIDFEAFSKKCFTEATWVTPVPIDYGKEDWRQAETIPCLAYSNAEWIWFTEQDFFVNDWDKFFADVEKAMQKSDMIGWWNPTNFPYVHPSCIFIKRTMLDKTTKDFSAHPEINGCDHFAMLTADVQRLKGKITTLQDLGWENWKNAFHLGGLTYVYQDWKGDGTDAFGVGNPEAFYNYNYWSRQAPVEQSPEYQKLSIQIERALENKYQANPRWEEFFKLWRVSR